MVVSWNADIFVVEFVMIVNKVVYTFPVNLSATENLSVVTDAWPFVSRAVLPVTKTVKLHVNIENARQNAAILVKIVETLVLGAAYIRHVKKVVVKSVLNYPALETAIKHVHAVMPA